MKGNMSIPLFVIPTIPRKCRLCSVWIGSTEPSFLIKNHEEETVKYTVPEGKTEHHQTRRGETEGSPSFALSFFPHS